MFGRKKPAKLAKDQHASGDGPPPEGSNLPWAHWPDAIGCNFALGHLTRNLSVPVTENGGIHAETYMCAAGAIAGTCANISFVVDKAAVQRANEEQQVQIVTLQDGRQLLFGDAINGMLMSNDPVVAQMRVWNLMAGTAIAHGLPQEDLPSLEHMFGHVTKSLGGEREGYPSVEANHQPHHSALGVLKRVWPVAHQSLTGQISEICRRNGFAAAETSWCAVSAQAAARMLAECSGVLSPKVALTIAMESAIYASKIMKVKQP